MECKAILSVLAIGAALTLHTLAEAPVSITVTLDTAGEFPLNRDAFGFNNSLIHRPFHYSEPDFVARYNELGRPMLRYPGGTTANYINVLTGQVATIHGGKPIERLTSLNELLRKRWGDKGKNMRPFADFVKKTGARWSYVVNLCTMTPEENRQLFLEMKRSGIAPSRIELGNEVYCKSYKPFIHDYPKQARAVAMIARNLFPDAKLGVVIPESYYTHEVFLDEGVPTDDDFKLKWINEIRTHDFYDAIIIHFYTNMSIHWNARADSFPEFPVAYRHGLSHQRKQDVYGERQLRRHLPRT